jgi:predicted DNA-binding transcriptional regulator AlpA
MPVSDPILDKLDELVRATLEAGLGERYLDAEGVGLLLGYSYTYTRDLIVHTHDFPAALRMGDGHPRWLKSDVMKWAKGRASRRRSA